MAPKHFGEKNFLFSHGLTISNVARDYVLKMVFYRLYANVLKQARQLVHKFVQQEISEIDIAALAYMIYSLESMLLIEIR